MYRSLYRELAALRMSSKSVFFAPGKLFIVGEYAVLYPLGKAILIPTKKGITVTASFRKRFRIRNRQFIDDNQVFLNPSDIRNSRMRLAIEVCRIYLESLGYEWKPFSLIVNSMISQHDEKYGLGSSGAIVVATIGAILKLYGVVLSPLNLYKLSVKAMMSGFSNSSFADLAVSSFQQPIVYARFSDATFTYVQTHFTPNVLLQTWNGLHIEPIPFPTHEWRVLYSGVSSDSTPLVQRARVVIDTNWIQESNDLVDMWLREPSQATLQASSSHLKKLDIKGSVGMFNTPVESLLTWAKTHHLDAKFSGAGGGDCVLIRATDTTWETMKQHIPHPAKALSGIIE
jgi:phosphomevalonate kinase